MMPQTLLALALSSSALLPSASDLSREGGFRPGGEPAAEVRYEPETRQVTNWRAEALAALEPKPMVVMAAWLKAERPFITRCVRLNNYWCIKSARWNGEIAKDSEGHVGFASADHGADAAATLLRRYYLEFNRKSALDVVRRWAPAECNVATGIGGLAVLAVRGIGGTVRARYLASRRAGKAVRYTAQAKPGGKPGRVSMSIPMRPAAPVKTPQFRVPDIAAGMGERTKPAARPQPLMVARARPAPQAATTASSTTKAEPKASARLETATTCAPDERRLRNYAERMVGGLGIGATDDLKLFAEDGRPLPNLAHVMLAMSAFELGALRASPDLVERAIQRAAEKVEASAREALAQDPTPSLQR
jgi:hypothetical protein